MAVQANASDLSQSGPPDVAAFRLEPAENPENTDFDGAPQEGSQSGNSSTLIVGQTESFGVDPAEKGSYDPVKLAHADEM